MTQFWIHLSRQLLAAAQWCERKAGVKPSHGRRICGGCKRQVKRGDRWHMIAGQVRHFDCIHPNVIPLPDSLVRFLDGTDDAA